MPERTVRLGGAVPGATPPRRVGADERANNLYSYPWCSQASFPVADSLGAASAVHLTTARSSALRLTSSPPLARFGHFPLHRRRIPLFYALTSYCGTFDILRLLTREGQASKFAMSRKLPPTPKAIASSVHCLEWLGLIERVPSSSRSKPYRLTSVGKDLLAKPLDAWPSWLTVSSSRTPQ